ncbi:hypothetical protein BgiBS90_002606 [Biomphalaria glabrata]|nr:hypothetical protein BgiBS90_002606 [Biomphalaria glabrata]
MNRACAVALAGVGGICPLGKLTVSAGAEPRKAVLSCPARPIGLVLVRFGEEFPVHGGEVSSNGRRMSPMSPGALRR